jgi:phosphatidylglycerol lysyltransferase
VASSSSEPCDDAPLPLARWAHAWPHWRPWLLGGLGLLLVLLVGTALAHLLQEVRYGQVMAAVRQTPGPWLLWSLLATAVSYATLTQYDASALRYIGARVPRGTVALTAFVAYALSNTIGLGPLSGGAVRMRYTQAGWSRADRAGDRLQHRGLHAGHAGLRRPGPVGAPHPCCTCRPAACRPGRGPAGPGGLCGAVPPAAGAGLALGPGGAGMGLRLPPAGLALAQLAISAVELTPRAGAVVPAAGEPLPLLSFLALYAVAISAALVSHVPGGVGVFEAVMLLAAGPHLPTAQLLGALLLYRGLYYVLPLVLASGLLVAYELRPAAVAPMGRAAVRQSPRLLAALTLVAGLWLVVSGVTPFTRDAREVLVALNVPLPLIEASHFLGSVAGLGLLVVARGLLHRLDAAWWAALVLSLVAAAGLAQGHRPERGGAARHAGRAAGRLAPPVRPPVLAVRPAPGARVAAGPGRRAAGQPVDPVLRLQAGGLQQPPVVAVRAGRPGPALAARPDRHRPALAGPGPVAAAAAPGQHPARPRPRRWPGPPPWSRPGRGPKAATC